MTRALPPERSVKYRLLALRQIPDRSGLRSGVLGTCDCCAPALPHTSSAIAKPPPTHRARRLLTMRLLAPEMSGIPLVLADVFDQLRVRKQIEHHGDAPRLSIGFLIVDGELNLEVAEVAAPISLDEVQGISGRMTPKVEPRIVDESRGVDHERVALPCAA